MNKPKKTMCTSNDEFDRTTVIDLIPCKERIFTVGRLDYDTSGVLLLTNDGEFANEIIHPRYHIPKVCVVDFLVGADYDSYARNRAKAHHEISSDAIENGQRKILLLCEQPRTRKELMYMLDVPSKKIFFRLYLKPLLEAGTLQMTIPNQRSVSTQRYVRV